MMKKFTIVEKNKNGLQEVTYYGENAKEVKELDGFIAIVSTSNVKHPSPDVLQRVLLTYQLNSTKIELTKFYEDCDALKTALEGEVNGVQTEVSEKEL